MEKTPYFSRLSYFSQFILLVGIALISSTLFFLLSAVIALPIYGLDGMFSGGFVNNLNDDNTVSALKLMQLFNAIGLFIIPPFVFAKLTQLKSTEYLGFTLKTLNPILFVITFFLVFLALPAINGLAELNKMMVFPEFLSGVENWMKLKEKEAEIITEAFLRTSTIYGLLYNLLLIAVIPAIGEELLFRGALQKLFQNWSGNIHIGIWIAAFIFSALHGQFYGFLPRMLLGAMFGYLFVWSGSLWLPIFAHFVNNGTAVIVSFLVNNGTIQKEMEDVGGGSEGFVFAVISSVLVLGLFFLFKKKAQTTSFS
jgi:uncharacterized protein